MTVPYVTDTIRYIGVNDHTIDLFEGQYAVPNGMAYNSYVILDEHIAVMDTVDAAFHHEWMDNLQEALNGAQPKYLIIQHMEPDHSANILRFANTYPRATIVASAKAFTMMENFFGADFADRRIVIADGDTLSLGAHTLTFIAAPMVHWPEVMLTYDSTEKVLFSADAFGKFGALDVEDDWEDEARRYYIGIVGKYGVQVTNLLKKAAGLDIATICPLHGPVLTPPFDRYLSLYQTWASYTPEDEGVVLAYTSIYGNTEKAVMQLAEQLRNNGCPAVVVYDLARCDIAQAVADAFRYNKLVLATTTYNADIFPPMRAFIEHLTERNFQNRTVAFIENGSWAPMATKVMRRMLENAKNLTETQATVTLLSGMSAQGAEQLHTLGEELSADYRDRAVEHDDKALFTIGYGLYVVTSRDGDKDNGLIVNTVTQLTATPNRVAVTINKDNYSHRIIQKSGKLNVNCLTVNTPFSVFQQFGFQSGRTVDKFEGIDVERTENGLVMLPQYSNAVLSLEVERYVDMDTHGMFICTISAARVLNKDESMTYAYYHKHVKPQPEPTAKKGFVCTVCGYVHESDTLPPDFVCPLCKHGASDFVPLT